MVDKIGIYTMHVFDQQMGVKAPSNVPNLLTCTCQYQILEREKVGD